MANAKTKLVNALLDSAALLALLGGRRVFKEYPSAETSAMRAWIIYYELSNVPQMADGREYFADATYQVSIYSEKSTTKISEVVEAALSAADFERQMAVDDVENDETRVIFVRSTQYRIVLEV